MGKTNKPLTIIALPPVSEWPELEKLRSQGHTVIQFKPIEQGFSTEGASCVEDAVSLLLEADVVLGINCWRMDKDLRRHLALAIKSARVLRYKDKEDRLDEDVAKKELDLGLDDSPVDGSETTGKDGQG